MADSKMLTFLAILACVPLLFALPEKGVREFTFNKDTSLNEFYKSMYNGSSISVKLQCQSEDDDLMLKVGWILRYSPCAEEYLITDEARELMRMGMYYNEPYTQLYPDFKYTTIEYIKFPEEMYSCGSLISLPDWSSHQPTVTEVTVSVNSTSDEALQKNEAKKDEDTGPKPGTADNKATDTGGTDKATARRKRAGESETGVKPNPEAAANPSPAGAPKPVQPVIPKAPQPLAAAGGSLDAFVSTTESVIEPIVTDEKAEKPVNTGVQTSTSRVVNAEKPDLHDIAKTWKDGYFIFVMRVEPAMGKTDFTATAMVRMLGPHGYISAVDWPLLIFYGVMGLVYIFYGLLWLVMLACNWRDLLRVQYWIGAVVLLGMLEKAVFYAEYQSIAHTGESVTKGSVIFAELVSCLKRALARMLVIIVSLGFGIVKPRLGPTFHKVLFVGAVYFIVGSIEGCMRSLKPKGDQSSSVLLAAVPLAIVDASICWWIFSSLVQTTRTLRLRRNLVKLTLYRHFTNTLIFAVLASIIFMIWSFIELKLKTCLTDWKELWVDEAFWHLLFSVMLLLIMILWRPSVNNQRYAFSPLLDAADDEDEEDETVLNDAFQGMKMRSKGQANGSPKQKESNVEDDLKWVEENIPSSVTDKALPSLLDSDEEIMTAKYEMSKMQ